MKRNLNRFRLLGLILTGFFLSMYFISWNNDQDGIYLLADRTRFNIYDFHVDNNLNSSGDIGTSKARMFSSVSSSFDYVSDRDNKNQSLCKLEIFMIIDNGFSKTPSNKELASNSQDLDHQGLLDKI